MPCPIVGAALDVSRSPELATCYSPLATSFHEMRNSPSATLTLLAMDMEGYSNLCQLVTLRHLGTTKLPQDMNSAEIDGRPVTCRNWQSTIAA
jgi:DNA polymerase III alpha subunit